MGAPSKIYQLQGGKSKVECKRRAERECALQIFGNISTCYITTASQACFSLLKKILNNYYIQKLEQYRQEIKL